MVDELEEVFCPAVQGKGEADNGYGDSGLMGRIVPGIQLGAKAPDAVEDGGGFAFSSRALGNSKWDGVDLTFDPGGVFVGLIGIKGKPQALCYWSPALINGAYFLFISSPGDQEINRRNPQTEEIKFKSREWLRHRLSREERPDGRGVWEGSPGAVFGGLSGELLLHVGFGEV